MTEIEELRQAYLEQREDHTRMMCGEWCGSVCKHAEEDKREALEFLQSLKDKYALPCTVQ